MKKLELTDSPVFHRKHHKDMLMEMCSLLCDDTLKDCYWADGDLIGFVGGGERLEIHWVEICLIHLPKVLATNVNWDHSIASRIASHVHEFYYHPKHMVDYLYQEYQEKTIWKKIK